jgi:UDP-N-acetylglucosamine 2-epimerase (non-hydrolysing)
VKIVSVVGARPNFMKIAPILRALAPHGDRVHHVLVHTGQHYDVAMSQVFFDQLELPAPDEYLGVGSGTHAQQTARVMVEFERVCEIQKPDVVIVVGDVNSTLACALVSAKLQIPVAHVEAGLRSFDRTMPEEINRVLTDAVSSHLFVSERSGLKNLKKEGVDGERVHFVGNTMIDTLLHVLPKTRHSEALRTLGVGPNEYCVVTLHRPANVDTQIGLQGVVDLLEKLAGDLVVVFPVHPRTRKTLESFELTARAAAIGRLRMADPLPYIDFVALMASARLVLTDSGGIQEESTVLGVPCVTMRDNTERPATVEEGTNILAGTNPNGVWQACKDVLAGKIKQGRVPPLWDGHAGDRIVRVLLGEKG